jgi:hypothetical protein
MDATAGEHAMDATGREHAMGATGREHAMGATGRGARDGRDYATGQPKKRSLMENQNARPAEACGLLNAAG